MKREVALFIALAFAAGLGEPSTAWAQAKDASKKEAPAKTETKAADPKAAAPTTDNPRPGRVWVDINTASLAELQALPGMNAEYAKKIVENRPYKWKDQLVRKKILPEDLYETIRKQLEVKPPRSLAPTVEETGRDQARIDLNMASVAELRGLPGMNAEYAHKIIQHRPYRWKHELLERQVIPDGVYDGIRDKVVTRRGVNINTASLAELRTLPGMTAGYAQRIVDNRPYRKTKELVERQIIPQATFDEIEFDLSARLPNSR